jgi:hypothetical protein
MAWRLEGTYFENCNCDVICPCATSTQEQMESLGAVFSGQLGGPPAALAPLIGENLGVEVTEIEYEDDGLRHRARVGGVSLEVEDVVIREDGQPLALTGMAFPNETVTVARGIGAFEAFGLSVGGEGKSALSAPFSWAA